jgi:precorrin-6B methylase 2
LQCATCRTSGSSLTDDVSSTTADHQAHRPRRHACGARASAGELLWDVGAGAGSIAVEWCRSQPGCAAVAYERDELRRTRIGLNAAAFGVRVDVRGAAPEAFDGAPDPAAIFVGGGLTQPGLLDACFDRLPAGGRFAANAVTAESAAIAQWYLRLGGELRRFQHYHGEPLGSSPVGVLRCVTQGGHQATTVHFIGAGPGAADPIIVRGQRLPKRAWCPTQARSCPTTYWRCARRMPGWSIPVR